MKKIKIDILISEISHEEGTKMLFPLHLPQIVRLNQSPTQMADLVYGAIHKDWLQNGNYDFLLKHYLPTDINQEVFSIKLEASPEKLFPELHLEFDLVYVMNKEGHHIGFIPALNLESSGKDLEELKVHLKENIKLEFIRKKRLSSIKNIIEIQWFRDFKLHRIPVDFSFYTLSELDQIQEQEQQALLPQIAQHAEISTERVLFGLEKEFDLMTQALKGRNRNSVIVISNAGKGKTALVQEFCRQKEKFGLGKVAVWEVSAAQLLHRLSGLGSWEEYLGDLCRELRKSGDILYINNFAELFEVGQYVGNSMSMGDYLRDYISRGDITLITECTPEAISRIELRSPGYIGLFTSVVIGELSDAQILHTVSQKTQQLGEAKGTLIEENAIQEILRLQKWFTPYSELPGKTIHFLHALISDKERSELKIIDKSSIHKRFSQETGMPEFMINPDTALDVEVMNTFFQQNIYGQLEAIETVTDLLISVKVAVIRRGKPLASLLFVGPTGVGKTEMAKVLAEFMFGNRNKMIRFDMSEYADLQGIMRLTGDSGGEGLLTAAVRQAPFSVLLFDELEKVHPAFYDLLLQILGEGRLTDARGRVADFCSTIIIMTSNIGARSFQSGSIGFGDSANTSAGAAEHFKTQVQNYFRPELFNRLDRIIAFAPLDQEIVRKIIDREISLIRKREGIKNRNLSLDIHKEVLDYLGKVGYDARYGARFLQRTLQEQLVIPLSKHLNTYYFDNPLSIKITLKDTVIEFEIEILEKIDPLYQDISEEGNLTLIGFERIITQARREANTIEGGSYFAKLQSQLDQLERKRTKLKRTKKESDFWKNEQESKKYFLIQDLQQKFLKAFAEIREMELEILLILHGLDEKKESLWKMYQAWESNFKVIKSQLVLHENPEFKICTLGIYSGDNGLLELVNLYQKFATRLELGLVMNRVWLNQNTNEYVKEEYHKIDVPSYYYLCGVEMQFSGEKMPYLYLKGESGPHFWGSIHSSIVVDILVTNQDLMTFETPEEVHRKKKKESPIKRWYQVNSFYDQHYDFHTADISHIESLLQACEVEFHQNVDYYLL